MDCIKCKDLILTDYIDGQMQPKAKAALEAHIAQCADCAALAKEAGQLLSVPFAQAQRQEVPPYLWHRIKTSVERQAYAPAAPTVWERLRGAMALPRLAPALATFVLVALVGTVSIKQYNVQQAKAEGQGQYLAYVLASSDTAESDNGNLGTSLEDYFL